MRLRPLRTIIRLKALDFGQRVRPDISDVPLTSGDIIVPRIPNGELRAQRRLGPNLLFGQFPSDVVEGRPQRASGLSRKLPPGFGGSTGPIPDLICSSLGIFLSGKFENIGVVFEPRDATFEIADAFLRPVTLEPSGVQWMRGWDCHDDSQKDSEDTQASRDSGSCFQVAIPSRVRIALRRSRFSLSGPFLSGPGTSSKKGTSANAGWPMSTSNPAVPMWPSPMFS